jgi:polyisoprenyl-phosphate glycosyltransferase
MSRRVTPSPLQVDIIVPVYNEEEVIGSFHQQLLDVITHLPYHFTITYVDDGSKDQTLEKLKTFAAQDKRVSILELSRNFGHQAALTAGMDQAEGDYVITLDGDGQHPPKMIAEMLRLADGGYDMVLTQRLEQESQPAFKRWSSNMFYNLSNRITDTQVVPGGADFRLLKRPVILALRGMREYHRFLRGMVAWTGFKSIILPFTPPARMAGKSKFSLRKMLQLASDAIFSFSLAPLYLSLSMALVFFVLALAEVIYVLSFWVSGKTSSLAPGWSSLMFVLLLVGGFIMLLLGFIGIYVGYIFQEVKHRPIYLVRNSWKISPAEDKEME